MSDALLVFANEIGVIKALVTESTRQSVRKFCGGWKVRQSRALVI